MSESVGLAQYDRESKIWRIMEICHEKEALRRSDELEIETGLPVSMTYYGKNDMPQFGEQVWID